MTIGLSTDTRTARMQALADKLDAAPTPGKFLLYTTPRPATGAAITSQTLLGTCVLSDPCGTVSAGVLTFAAISNDTNADNNGDILWVRGLNGDNGFVIDMGAGVSGSGAEIIFNTLTVQAGGVIQILSGSLTDGNV
jgi:hypothetical protein